MAAISENFGDLLDPRFRKIFSDAYNSIPPKREMLYKVDSSTKDTERDSSVGAFGDISPFNGTIHYDDVTQGYDVVYTHVEFAEGFKIQRKLYDDDQFRIMDKKPAGLGISAQRTKEKYAATPFNNAFSGSGTIVIQGTTVLNNSEALSLCNDSHTSTASSTTQDNSGTSAISATSVEATRKAMRAFKDDRDNFIAVMPDTILVPPNLEEEAWKIANNPGQIGTGNNDLNFSKTQKYNVLVWDYLTSSNSWFLIDSKLMKANGLNWITRIPLEFKKDGDFDTFMAKWAVYERYSFGWSDWRFCFGHSVS